MQLSKECLEVVVSQSRHFINDDDNKDENNFDNNEDIYFGHFILSDFIISYTLIIGGSCVIFILTKFLLLSFYYY